MSKSLRIDSVLDLASDGIQVSYTAGEGPLPQSPSGSAFLFASRQALFEAIEGYEDSISSEHLAFVGLSPWIKVDPQMLNPELAAGRVVQLDLTGATETIEIT